MSGRLERFDARPGGSYRLVLTYADASAERLRAVISQTFPLPEGQQAFQSGAGARRPGKTVLVVR